MYNSATSDGAVSNYDVDDDDSWKLIRNWSIPHQSLGH